MQPARAARSSALTAARGKRTAPRRRAREAKPARVRVLAAAFSTFRDRGFAGASTLEIATRAKVSKRELYALFDDKQAMIAACIEGRAGRMREPLALPAVQTLADLKAALTAFGIAILRGASDDDVLAVYRFAIAESEGTPAIARTLDTAGRQANRGALVQFLQQAQSRRLLRQGDAAAMAEAFFAVLWGDLLVRLLLRVAAAPSAQEAEQRARAATDLLLTLHSAGGPDGGGR